MKHINPFNESKVGSRNRPKKSKIDWEKFYEDILEDEYFKKFKFTQLDDMCSRKYVEKQLK
jgi:hypothetical protein